MKITTAALTIGCAAAMAFSAIGQQQAARAVLSPVPSYPTDGRISDELTNSFVFIDHAKNELVVTYPDQSEPGGRIVRRFELASQVDPLISAAVAARSDGTYVYRYSLQNGPGATRAVQRISILVPKDEGKLAAHHPSWSVGSDKSEVSRSGALRPEALLTWQAAPVTQLSKGGQLGGFEISSEYRPGLTIAVAGAAVAKPLTAEVAATFPKAVQDQLAPVMKPELNAAQAMTIGPRFAPDDPKSIIAMDFHGALNKLAVLGPLKPDSPFVSAALAALVFYMSAPDSSSPRLDFLDKAAPGLESEIAAAMRISLR